VPTDTQIPQSQVAAAPADYLVPPSVELLLKAVRAEFTDNGAAGDWLPCVTLLSDSGHPIVDCSDQGVKVTAGSDAQVSWFPGVKAAAAGAFTGLPWCYADASLDLTGNPPSYVDFVTTDATMYAVDVPNGRIQILQTGSYLAFAHLEIQSNTLPATQGITLGTTLNAHASSSDSAAIFGPWDIGNPGGSAGSVRSWLPAQLTLCTINSISNVSNPPTLDASASANPAAVASGDFTFYVVRVGGPLGTPL
jgi:hypothetical protein